MNSRKIFDQELYAHFIRFSCYRRRRLLDHDQPKRILLGMLGDQLRRQSATCVGFVVMPDHVQCNRLVSPDRPIEPVHARLEAAIES